MISNRQFARIGDYELSAIIHETLQQQPRISMHTKEWTRIFKALGNENRLKILRLLKARGVLPVKDISEGIGLGPKATSKHCIILGHLDILQNEGKRGHVWYFFHPQLKPEVRAVVQKFIDNV